MMSLSPGLNQFMVLLFRRRWLIGVGLMTLCALFLRTYQLTDLPSGLHGDEGVAGLEGLRILREGYIGPYSWPAHGQPTGPLYLFALAEWALGPTILAVRLVPALAGTLTIPLLFCLLRKDLGPGVALLSAGFLTVMEWHLHFSRIGFPVGTWPCFVLSAAAAITKAVERPNWVWWALAGAATGLGIYIYNAYIVVSISVFVFISGYCLFSRTITGRRKWFCMSVFCLAFILANIPMIRFAGDKNSGYFGHFKKVSVLDSDSWRRIDSPIKKAYFLLSRYASFWGRLTWRPEVDFVDAAGVTPMVSPVIILLAAVGMLKSIRRHRPPVVYLGIILVLIVPVAAVASMDGQYRRTLALVPFLAMLAALGAAEVSALVRTQRKAVRWIITGGLVVIISLMAGRSLQNYFIKFAHAPVQKWVFCQELTEACSYMTKFPPGFHFLFYSNRWSVDYETRQFLAPKISAEDRSVEFGRGGHDTSIDPAKGYPVFVFMGRYKLNLDLVRNNYPGGLTASGTLTSDQAYLAYIPISSQCLKK
ncbi:MAG: glycosyltransferase family 39 protein [Deltaproteobacteria bacterium]|nr:glycosyltransferase family 39 protein [Deltaproteobacteria bacterium]